MRGITDAHLDKARKLHDGLDVIPCESCYLTKADAGRNTEANVQAIAQALLDERDAMAKRIKELEATAKAEHRRARKAEARLHCPSCGWGLDQEAQS